MSNDEAKQIQEEVTKTEEAIAEAKKVGSEVKEKIDLSPLEEAKQILDENKKLLFSLTEERKRLEKAAANMMISGKGFGGIVQKEETEDEKWRREAKIRYAGTGMDPT